MHTSNGEVDVNGNTTQARTRPTLGVKVQVTTNQNLRRDEIYDALRTCAEHECVDCVILSGLELCLAVGSRLRAHRSLTRWERCAYDAMYVPMTNADGRMPIILANEIRHQ